MTAPPSIADLIQQGLFHHRQGQLPQAIERYSDVLRIDPGNPDALYYAAVIACQENQFKQGIDLARRALERDGQARVHNLIGKALEREGDPLEAVKSFDQAIAADPNFAEAHGNRAGLLAKAGLPAEALKGFDRALALDPKAEADWINRGALLHELGRHKEALASYDRALALMPDNPSVQMNRAGVLALLGRFAEAEAAYDRIIARAPKVATTYAHKALAVKHQGRLDEARALLEQAQKMQPDDADTAVALAQTMLLMGDWRAAWPLFERRAKLKPPAYHALAGERWRGQGPGDYRLVVMGERGLTDTVMFSRYASLLAARGHGVTLLAPPALAPLLRSLPGIEKIASSEDELAGDKRRYMWVPLLSTMGMLHLTADAVPAQPAYLHAEPGRAARSAERLGAHGFKVGIVWRDGNNGVPLSALAPLAEAADVRLISLQFGPAAGDIAQAPFGARIEQPLDPNIMNADALLDLVGVIAQLDLVVGIDSLPLHLAGALGCPAFAALEAVPDWRWLMGRDDTPWYANMRLFRQPLDRQWPPVFERMAAEVQTRRQVREP
jgi:tetratricopeptide (TPR) repeat protein